MRQVQSSTRRHELKPADMQLFLAELLPVGEGALPLQVVGWTRRGVWTRMRADYPNGTVLTVSFDRTGAVSSAEASLSATIPFRGGEK